MPNIKQFIHKSSFIKNVGTLMTGTVLAQALTVLASPVLSRIFSPEDFGLLATFTSVYQLLIIACSGKYEQAILLPKEDTAVYPILISAVSVCCVFTLLSPFIILIGSKFSSAFMTIRAQSLVLTVCVFVFCSGISEILRVFFLRNKLLRAISSRTFIVSLITVGLNLICGLLWYNSKTLVKSTTYGQIASLILFGIIFIKIFKNKIPKISFADVKISLIKYKEFPFFLMPGQFLNTLTGNLPILVMSNYFSADDIGQYSFVYKLVQLPMVVIGANVQQVFFQKISQKNKNYQKKVYIKTSGILFAIILFPSVLCYIFAPQLVTFVFGEKWLQAAFIARNMTLMLILQFATSPICGTVFILNKKLKYDFTLEIFRLLLIVLSFIVSVKLQLSFNKTILVFSLFLGVFYLTYFLCELIYLSKKTKIKN